MPDLTDLDLVDAESEAKALMAAAAELEHLVAEKLRLTVELERMAAERDTARELARETVSLREENARLREALEEMASQNRCGCGHPACTNCQRDEMCRLALAPATTKETT